MRINFSQAVATWAAISHLQFGPIVKDTRAQRISFWPDPRSAVWRQVRAALRDRKNALTAPDFLAKQSVAIQGLTALEWLLPHGDSAAKKTAEKAKFECNLAIAISNNVARVAKSVHEEWKTGGQWRQTWGSTNSDHSENSIDRVAMTALIRSALLGLELIRERQVLLIQDLASGSGHASRLPYFRSGNSGHYLRASIDGVCELLGVLNLGAFAPKDKSWIRQWLPNACQRLKVHAQKVVISKSNNNFAETIDAFDIRQLRFYTNGLRQIIGRQIAPSAGLTIGFNELDGD